MNTDMVMKFTYIDAAVLVIILVSAVINAKKGLARALLRFMPTFLGVVLSWKMSGSLIKYTRGTLVFDVVKNKIAGGLKLENLLPDMTLSAQNNIISGMNMPDFIKQALITNNNSVVYGIFDASTLGEYIAGFLTNVIISVGAVIILYFVGMLIGKLILKALDTSDDDSVLGTLSRAGGFAVGIIKGVCIIWIAGIVLTFFCYEPWAQSFIALLEQSVAAGWLYRNNILLYVVLQIIA